MLRVVAKPCGPEHFARRRERRGAVGAEVDVDAIAVDDRCRRRTAVLQIDRAGAVDLEHFRIDDLAPGGDIETNQTERDDGVFASLVASRIDSRDPDAPGCDHRR